MIKKICLLLLLAPLLCLGIAAQSGGNLQTVIDSIIQPLESDISTILDSVGSDVLDTLQANSLSGDVFGEATFGSKTFSLTLPGIGLTASSGIGSVLNDGVWNSDILPLGPLIGNALGQALNPLLGTTGTAGFDFIADQVMPWPSLNLGLGINLGSGFEVFANGMYLPFSLIGDIVGTTGDMAILQGLDGSIFQLQLKFRKVLVQDTPDTIAFSVGLGYAVNAFSLDLSLDNTTLTSLIGGPLAIDGVGDLTVDQMALSAHTVSHNIGIDLNFSKRLVFFVPFLSISPYVQISSVEVAMPLSATLTENQSGTNQTFNLEMDPGTSTFSAADLSVLVRTGFEFDLFLFTLHTGVSLDLENIALNLGNLSPEEIVMNGIGVNLGLRWAY